MDIKWYKPVDEGWTTYPIMPESVEGEWSDFFTLHVGLNHNGTWWWDVAYAIDPTTPDEIVSTGISPTEKIACWEAVASMSRLVLAAFQAELT